MCLSLYVLALGLSVSPRLSLAMENNNACTCRAYTCRLGGGVYIICMHAVDLHMHMYMYMYLYVLSPCSCSWILSVSSIGALSAVVHSLVLHWLLLYLCCSVWPDHGQPGQCHHPIHSSR